MRPISRPFYSRDTVEVAVGLLGKTLVRRIGELVISGIISETEAYKSEDDPASHSFKGITERNKAMFGEVGRAYIYFTYGMHYCVNAVARDQICDSGAVLIRSIIPREGINFMKKQRKTVDISNLANGPAKLTQAMRITKSQYGEDMTKVSRLYITDGIDIKKQDVESKPRIGIKNAKDKLWNFSIRPLSNNY